MRRGPVMIHGNLLNKTRLFGGHFRALIGGQISSTPFSNIDISTREICGAFLKN